jgi:two-component system sensor histidine kinase KdpD
MLLGDLLIVFALQTVYPQTRFIAVIGYILMVAFYSLIGGLPAGAIVTAAAIGLTVAAQIIHPGAEYIDAFNLAMFGAAALALAFLLEQTGAEQRRALRDLDETVVALERARAELEEAHALEITERQEVERVRSEFISMVTHDLRTPLTSIKGFAELIRDSNTEPDDSDNAEYLSYIEKGASELESLTDQLLEYSRLETGRMDLSWERIPVATWIGDLLEQMAPVLSEHVVTADVAPDLEVEADPIALRRVLSNLVQNAAKFSPAGTAITVTARSNEGRAVFTVADQGPGISAGDRSRVFEAFYRGSRNGSSAKGTGLGLAIAQRYVELHGGCIWIEDSNTNGTTISLELPLAQPAVAA